MTLDTTRLSHLSMDPSSLTIIGVDTKDGKEHPLWDPRINLPVNQAMVNSIKLYGIIEPVIGQTDGDKTIVVDGRQRVLHARLVNAQGGSVKVPVVMRRGDNKTLFGIARTTNAIRVEDSPINNAHNAQRMLDMGASETECAIAFGVSEQTIKEWTTLLDLHPDVQSQVHSGELSQNAGLSLAELPQSEQPTILSEIRAAGQAPSGERVASRVRAAKGKTPSQTPKVRCEKASECLMQLAKLGSKPGAEALQAALDKMCRALLSRSWDKVVVAMSKED